MTDKNEKNVKIPICLWESLKDDNNLLECIIRNIKKLSFTTPKILRERKRLLQEIKMSNANLVILSGNEEIIEKILFDYTLKEGYILAPELTPIFNQIDFAIKCNNGPNSLKAETLYSYCKYYFIKPDEDMFCGYSKEEFLCDKEVVFEKPKYIGSTCDEFISIVYMEKSRINNTGVIKQRSTIGNLKLIPFSTRAYNTVTDEYIDNYLTVVQNKKSKMKK